MAKQPSKKLRDFAYDIVYNGADKTRAYIHAGYANHVDSRVVSVNAGKLFKTPACQNEIARLQAKLAKELEAQQAETKAIQIIDRQRQTNKLETLRLKAESAKDLTTALGCIKEENAIYGLRIDVQAEGTERLEEIDADIKQKAAKLSPDIFSSLLNAPSADDDS